METDISREWAIVGRTSFPLGSLRPAPRVSGGRPRAGLTVRVGAGRSGRVAVLARFAVVAPLSYLKSRVKI